MSARGLLGAALAALLVLAGCGEKEDPLSASDPKPFELLLDYFPNADHAPIYAARSGGHFEDAGLDVEIRQPSDPAAPIKQVAAGRVDLAISYEPEVLRARDQGLNVVAVGALVREPLTSIISLPSARVSRVADLAGKKVGTAGIDYQSAFLRTVLKRAGVPRGAGPEEPNGYRAEASPHPVAARAKAGEVKTRLAPEPEGAPVVAEIFHLWSDRGLGCQAIADHLNRPGGPPSSAHVDTKRNVRGDWAKLTIEAARRG